jgi:DNA processing protein
MSTLATKPNPDNLEIAYSYCLSHLSNLSDRSALKLKKRFPSFQSWLRLTPIERQELSEATLGNESPDFINVDFNALVDRALIDLRKHEREGIRILSIDSNEYPKLLRLISNPPLVLFVKGSIEALSRNCNVAVVGTRDATLTGEKVACKIARWLAENGWCVVSGLAKGIDAAAHKGTLEAQACTVAVMATPLNKVYPAENRELAEAILNYGGCWISEFPLWKKPYRSAFVQRDRIQSGISVAVVPVQTDIEGGTMHTVRFAEQQRRLLLCPRPIQGEQHLRQYAGIRALIESQRATPFSGDEYEQVLGLLNNRRRELLESPPHSPSTRPPEVSTTPKADTTTFRKTTEPELNKSDDQGRRKLQGGFEFVHDQTRAKRQKSARKELKSQVELLEQLLLEIPDATRPDGSNITDIEDVKDWLRRKIRNLHAKEAE